MANYNVDMDIVSKEDILSKIKRLKGDYLDFCIAIAELQDTLDDGWGKIKRDLVTAGVIQENENVEIEESMVRGLSKKQKDALAEWHKEHEGAGVDGEGYERELIQSYKFMKDLEKEMLSYNDTVKKIIQRINYFSTLGDN